MIERAYSSNLISALVELPVTLQQNKLNSLNLGVAQAIEINKLSPAKFKSIDRDRAFVVIGDLKEKIIEEGLSVRETKALIKETIEQYSADCTDRFEKIEKWLKSFDDSAIDHLNNQELNKKEI